MILTLPWPPSANRYWRVYRGRAVKSQEARDYQAFVRADNRGLVLLSGPVCITAHLYRPTRRGDLDNSLKILVDSLQGVAYTNDNQIVELHAYRHEGRGNGRVEVNVQAVGAHQSEMGSVG